MLETGTVHFGVEFAGLTRIVRDMWMSGQWLQALDLLEVGCGLPRKVAEAVLRGERRLAQDPHGEPHVDGLVIADDWTPPAGYVMPRDLPAHTEKLSQWAREYFNYLSGVVACAHQEGEHHDWAWLPAEFVETLPPDLQGYVRGERAEPDAPPLVDAYLEKMAALERRPTPRPDAEYASDTGWILRDGSFYPCGRMEHTWLAERLGQGRDADEFWVKVGCSPFDNKTLWPPFEPRRPATPEQKDAVIEWCAVHTVSPPEWAVY